MAPVRDRLLCLLVTAALVLPALAAQAANRPVEPFGDPIDIPYGDDSSFSASRANLYFEDTTCTPSGEHLRCDADDLTQSGSSSAEFAFGGFGSADAGAGFKVRFVRSCDAQEIRGQAVVQYTYGYSLSTSSYGTGSSDARIVYRWSDVAEGGVAVHASAAAGPVQPPDQSAALLTFQPERRALPDEFDVTYYPSLSAFSRADSGADHSAEAGAYVKLHQIDLRFGDATPPVYEAGVASDDATPAEPSPLATPTAFLGWYQAPVRIHVDADDPYNSDAAEALTEPISCVREVRWVDADTGETRSADPGPSQGPVVQEFADDREYRIRVEAEDHNDNPGVSLEDGTVRTFFFGVDRTTPTGGLATTPSSPTGDAGWYRNVANQAPRVAVTCDDPHEASECFALDLWRDNLDDAAGAALLNRDDENVPEGRMRYTFRVADKAGNTGPVLGPVDVMYDRRAPSVAFATSVAEGRNLAGHPTGWWPSAMTVTPACVDPDPGFGEESGCLSHAPEAAFDVVAEGSNVVAWQARDVAGNAASGSRDFRLDLTDPGAATMHDLPSHSNVDPTPRSPFLVSWDSAHDGPSGVQHYEFQDNGATLGKVWHLTPTTAWAFTSIAEGEHCFRVRAVDRAERVGPWSAEECIVIDRTLPVVEIAAPAGGSFTDASGKVTPLPNLPQDQAIVMRTPLFVNVTAFDPYPSGVADVAGLACLELYQRSDATEPLRVPCTQGPIAYEAFGAVRERPAVVPPHVWPYEAVATDHAGNVASAGRTVTFVVVNVVTTPPVTATAGWTASLDWIPEEADDLTAYEVHRSTTADFVPSAATRVATITDPGTTTYTDSGLLSDAEYHYLVSYVYGDTATDSHTTAAKTSGGGGNGSPGDCGLLRCLERPYYIY